MGKILKRLEGEEENETLLLPFAQALHRIAAYRMLSFVAYIYSNYLYIFIHIYYIFCIYYWLSTTPFLARNSPAIIDRFGHARK